MNQHLLGNVQRNNCCHPLGSTHPLMLLKIGNFFNGSLSHLFRKQKIWLVSPGSSISCNRPINSPSGPNHGHIITAALCVTGCSSLAAWVSVDHTLGLGSHGLDSRIRDNNTSHTVFTPLLKAHLTDTYDGLPCTVSSPCVLPWALKARRN